MKNFYNFSITKLLKYICYFFTHKIYFIFTFNKFFESI
ncbi:hypothetical protein ATCC51562_1665 [Campylobacter concisus ATCC 51562]|uniref:Uncharacterized protein n=1 Tax=Campylobacter concisus ATCC 51562 TaxID=1242969 RepID=U2F7L0_9BACT|nr:hypothetical protein ATCC51562_1665 [Campylobacter concisus ATCC 51562]